MEDQYLGNAYEEPARVGPCAGQGSVCTTDASACAGDFGGCYQNGSGFAKQILAPVS